jgi:tetratricopeptide (TPR) repeat protein
VSALSVELDSGEQDRLHRSYALTAESYDLFLHARTMLPTYMTDKGRLLRARQLFERIVEQADGFSGGYAGLSQTYSLAVMRGYSSAPVEEANEALKLAQKAWDIDADFEMAEVAMASALQITGQSEDAIATLEKMLKSAPSNADAHAQRGRLLIWAGRAKEAIDPINTAVRLNPDFGSPYLIDLGLANFTSGDYKAAITAFEKNYARGGPIDDAGLAVWTASNNELGRSNEAAKILDRLFDRHPDFHLRSFWLLRLYERPEDRTRLNDIFQRANIPMDRPYTR